MRMYNFLRLKEKHMVVKKSLLVLLVLIATNISHSFAMMTEIQALNPDDTTPVPNSVTFKIHQETRCLEYVREKPYQWESLRIPIAGAIYTIEPCGFFACSPSDCKQTQLLTHSNDC